MALEEYRRKRRFDRTPEPGGKVGPKRKGKAGRFVVQKHDATRLHYDFRLESDGVLKSWAVPKGPSLDPQEKRLAVEVEDHPLDYGSFEGIIPEGEYGGGTVELWDQGRWHPKGDADEGFRKGHLKFQLDGEKLQGGWNLVRLKGDEAKPNWLLIKENDDAARPLAKGDILDERPESVASGRTVEQIAESPERVWSSKVGKAKPVAKSTKTKKETAKEDGAEKRARSQKGKLPPAVSPQLATLVAEPPAGEGWLFEIKLDGYRILAGAGGGKVRLTSRNGKDWTDRFPKIAEAVERLDVESVLLDGEVVAIDDQGRSSFQRLQNALRTDRQANLAYFVFDLLHLNGKDLTGLPLSERKEALRELLESAGEELLHFNDHVEGKGAAFFRHACDLGIEGIVAKQGEAPYRTGRGTGWLKIKCLGRQEVVIGGFTAPKGSRSSLGALLVGTYRGDDLHFAGKVGTGFNDETLADLARRLKPLVRKTSPFVDPPKGAEVRDVTWVDPKLVAEVAFTEWTDDGRLRHPSFQGLREDKTAREVKLEEPAPTPPAASSSKKAPVAKASGARTSKAKTSSAKAPSAKAVSAKTGARMSKAVRAPAEPEAATKGDAEVAGVRLSHPDRVLYPEQGVTKLDLARYYQAVERWILPHVAKRPLTLVRCPEGRKKACFYQKHYRDGMPSSIRSVPIHEEGGTREPYLYVDDLAGLVGLVQFGVLELHGWGALIDDVDRPDRLVFDLDPDPSVAWAQVIETAELLRGGLADLGLETFVQTTGGKGLHVVAPLKRGRPWAEVKDFAQAFAERLVGIAPDRFVSKASKAARTGKIFIDWLRNARGATAIVPYSSRAREGATVATPLSWKELKKVKPGDFTVATIPARLAKLKKDPWEEFWTTRQTIRAEALRALGL